MWAARSMFSRKAVRRAVCDSCREGWIVSWEWTSEFNRAGEASISASSSFLVQTVSAKFHHIARTWYLDLRFILQNLRQPLITWVWYLI